MACKYRGEEDITLEYEPDPYDPIKRPVGVVVPQGVLAGNSYDTEKKFFPLKVKTFFVIPGQVETTKAIDFCKKVEKSHVRNLAGITPDCPKETSYQIDYAYRGHDYGPTQTYHFQKECERYEVEVTDGEAQPKRHGRIKTDLIPPAKTKKHLRDSHRFVSGKKERKNISEYMATYSRLGREIIRYKLYEHAAAREAKAKKKASQPFH